MNIKIRPRSCLGCSVWLIAAVVAFVLFSNVYAKVRLHQAHEQAIELAQQLGYTPAGFLRSGVEVANVDIFTGSAQCRAELYFVTPLDLSEFEAQLLTAIPGTRPIDMNYSTDLYDSLPLTVDKARSEQLETTGAFPAIIVKLWFLPKERPIPMERSTVFFYQTGQMPARLAFRGREIGGNIAVIRWAAGRHPIWVWC